MACFGNVLRADDGAGVAVAQELARQPLPPQVTVLEVGIGGIGVVQELLAEPVDLLLIVDAVDLGRPAGTVLVQQPLIPDVGLWSATQRRDELADMHLATPARTLTLASGLGVLPARTLLVGIQTTDTDEPRYGLSECTARAVPLAAAQVRELIAAHAV